MQEKCNRLNETMRRRRGTRMTTIVVPVMSSLGPSHRSKLEEYCVTQRVSVRFRSLTCTVSRFVPCDQPLNSVELIRSNINVGQASVLEIRLIVGVLIERWVR